MNWNRSQSLMNTADGDDDDEQDQKGEGEK
jgi:hypothetical protein